MKRNIPRVALSGPKESNFFKKKHTVTLWDSVVNYGGRMINITYLLL